MTTWRVLACLVSATALAWAQAPTTSATFTGQVTSSSGAPVRNAKVELLVVPDLSRGVPTNAVDMQALMANRKNYTLESDAEGRFRVSPIDPGTYIARVTRNGYVPSPPQTVQVAGAATNVAVKMTRQSILSGRVVDDFGEALAKLRIVVYRKIYENGWQWQQAGTSTSGPDGTFSIGDLTAGRYYLSAADSQSRVQFVGVLSGTTTTTGPREEFVSTFYPPPSTPTPCVRPMPRLFNSPRKAKCAALRFAC
jgi:hypothetical protein